MLTNPTNKWNVIFLVNKIPINKIVIFKRSADRGFAPNFYTGIGGKVEPNEDIVSSAYRELSEETGLTDIRLEEFARAIIDGEKRLYYFWGILNKKELPKSNVGTLEWI